MHSPRKTQRLQQTRKVEQTKDCEKLNRYDDGEQARRGGGGDESSCFSQVQERYCLDPGLARLESHVQCRAIILNIFRCTRAAVYIEVNGSNRYELITRT